MMTAVRRRKPATIEETRWQFYYLAGSPAEICGGDSITGVEEMAETIREEWPNQGQQFRWWAANSYRRGGPGDVFQGHRFLIVRVT